MQTPVEKPIKTLVEWFWIGVGLFIIWLVLSAGLGYISTLLFGMHVTSENFDVIKVIAIALVVVLVIINKVLSDGFDKQDIQ